MIILVGTILEFHHLFWLTYWVDGVFCDPFLAFLGLVTWHPFHLPVTKIPEYSLLDADLLSVIVIYVSVLLPCTYVQKCT